MIASLFRPEAVVLEAAPFLVDEQLSSEELAFIKAAVVKRRAEFGTARVLARRALERLGFPPLPLVPAADRSPVWPMGVVGSITHTDGYCAVVLDRSPPAISVGIDIEKLADLDHGTRARILTAAEQRWLEGQPSGARAKLAILIFSAKEAYYKCQYPVSRRRLDFPDVQIEVDVAEGRFRARSLLPGLAHLIATLDGKFAFGADAVMCGVELLRAPDRL
jgi:4'-phosphopantetheinyl transferase EntD